MARLRTSNEVGDDGKMKRFFTVRPKTSKEKRCSLNVLSTNGSTEVVKKWLEGCYLHLAMMTTAFRIGIRGLASA